MPKNIKFETELPSPEALKVGEIMQINFQGGKFKNEKLVFFERM